MTRGFCLRRLHAGMNPMRFGYDTIKITAERINLLFGLQVAISTSVTRVKKNKTPERAFARAHRSSINEDRDFSNVLSDGHTMAKMVPLPVRF